tara:strand:+ start:2508 stop:2735 length:228 start_codon:yes stop_codon:yes gene_type:complete
MSKAIDEMTNKDLKRCTGAALNAVTSEDDTTTGRFEQRYEGPLSGWLDALICEWEDRRNMVMAAKCEAAYNELTA